MRNTTQELGKCNFTISTDSEMEIVAFPLGPVCFQGRRNMVIRAFNSTFGANPDSPYMLFFGKLTITNLSNYDTLYWNDKKLGLIGPSSLHTILLEPGNYEISFYDYGSSQYITKQITVSCAESCPISSSLCVSILPEPKAAFSASPSPSNNSLDLCKAETVYFSNESDGATSVIWDFGDGTSSALNDPAHTFFEPGVFEVKLIARNDCYFADTTTLTIQVSDAEIPEIQCLGPICQGDTATYRTNASCGDYHWAISPNGNILDGGGHTDDFVSVHWASGTLGTIELTVNACTGSVCSKPVREQVSIISGQATISGPQQVCPGSVTEYSIPETGGSNIVWYVPDLAFIKNGQGTNRITVEWGQYTGTNTWLGLIEVEYDNCFLGCSGQGALSVQMKPPSYLEGPIEACIGDNPSFKHKILNSNTISPANWQILDSLGNTIWSSPAATGAISPLWNFAPGFYTVKAEPSGNAGSCSAESGLQLQLLGPPAAPSIAGPVEICPDQFYIYTAQSNLFNAAFTWQVNDGGVISQKTGNSINVKWGDTAPFELSLRQSDIGGPGCLSDPANLTAKLLPPFSISGPSLLCRESTATYSAQDLPDMDYQWEIEPKEAGGIQSGQGTSSVEVFWQKSGPATLKLSACGGDVSFQIVISSPVPTEAIYPDSLCPGQLAQVQASFPFDIYRWKNENGTTVSTQAAPQLPPGSYVLETVDTAGCNGSDQFTIHALPAPEAKIFAATYQGGICPGGPGITLFSLQTEDGYDYQWYKNGSPIGSNMPTLWTEELGSYSVQVTNQWGCSKNSNLLLLMDCTTAGGECVDGICLPPGDYDPGEPPPGGGGCLPQGEINFTWSNTSCNEFQFQNTSVNALPGSFYWKFGDPQAGASNSSTLANPSHIFSDLGFFQVQLYGLFPNSIGPGSCLLSETKEVSIPVKAAFDVRETCAGMPTEFTDLSVFLPGTSISAWSWDFGDPASGSQNFSNEQHPTHVYNETGTFNVTLTVTSSTGCNTSFSKNIQVHGFPSASFDPPAANCAANTLQFNALSTNAATFAWEFGDPVTDDGNFSQQQNTWHAYPAAGEYSVKLTATNVYGCSTDFTNNVSIEANNLGGSIKPEDPAPICEGLSASFLSPPGGSTWLWSNSSSTSSITTSQAGIYSVTLTDATGCTYSPDPVALEVIPAPAATIRAVELNEFGQVTAYFDGSYTACEGKDIYLQMSGDPKYSYQWSDGSSGAQLGLTFDSGNFLTVGNHLFSVTITDPQTGCTGVQGPFPITVNGAPANVSISSDPPGPLCDGDEAVFSVNDPQPGLSYLWNTGQQATEMVAIAAGTYLVQATNQYGCKANSNAIPIHNAPPVGSVTAGCFTHCESKEICLPNLPEVAEFQWFLNGQAIPAPEGTVKNFNATLSGDYQVKMTSIHGCISTSDAISLTLDENTGEIGGQVWLDMNNNGMIDPADSLIGGIGLFLLQNGNVVNAAQSGTSGTFIFQEISSNEYLVQLDPATIPMSYEALISSDSAQLTGCGDTTGVQFLLKNLCPLPLNSNVQMSGCEGSSVLYNNVEILAGETQQIVFSSFFGCDSVVTVSVEALPKSTAYLSFSSCPGSSIEFLGETLMPGEQQDFMLQNQLGCDSILTVSVAELPASTGFLELRSCPNTPIEFLGETLMPGEQQDFMLQNHFGCDSILMVSVAELPASTGFLELRSCPNTPIEFLGETLMSGEQQDFMLQNQLGCDSVLTVNVAALLTDTTYMQLMVCQGDTLMYHHEILSGGDQTSQFFINENGCDSVVVVSVGEWPGVDFELLTEKICQGEEGFVQIKNETGTPPFVSSINGQNFQTAGEYNGLAAGQYELILQDGNGCEASQTIDIEELPPLVIAVEDYFLPCDDPHIIIHPEVLSQAGELHWSWHDGSNRDWCPVEQAGVYTFRVSDDCTEEEGRAIVQWEDGLDGNYFYIPNAFSPNGDNINDLFRAYPASGVEVLSFDLKVFDRWGNQVFETTDPEIGWDGVFRDHLQAIAVHVWWVQATVLVCGEEMHLFKKGDVTIVR